MGYFGVVSACFLVSLFWGGTNPFIKNGTTGIVKVKSKTLLGRLIGQIRYLIFNWRYIVPFLINQLGSVIYFFTLRNAPLSLVVPLTNSFTFCVTGVVGILLGEEKPDTRTTCGLICILIGITLCVIDASQ